MALGTTTAPSREPLATVSEVAEYLHVSRAKAYGLMEAGDLPYVKLGKSRRVRWSDVHGLLERSTVGGPAGK